MQTKHNEEEASQQFIKLNTKFIKNNLSTVIYKYN